MAWHQTGDMPLTEIMMTKFNDAYTVESLHRNKKSLIKKQQKKNMQIDYR